MWTSIAAHILPLGLALAIAGLAHLFGGAARGPRLAGAAVAIGFLAGWAIAVRPGWMAYDDITRIGHVVFGGLLLGLALDLLNVRRGGVLAATAIFVLINAWAAVNGGLRPHGAIDPAVLAAAVVLAILAFMMLSRLRTLSADPPTALILMMMFALGLTVVGVATDADRVPSAGLILAAALAGYLVWAWTQDFPVTETIILAAGGGLLAAAWALSQQAPGAVVGIILLFLILFADGTARRVPLPKARVKAVLYPLILAGIAALPIALALILAVVGAG